MPHPIGSTWTYTGIGWRNLGQARMEEYEIVRPCEIVRITYSANFPDVPRYVIRFENGAERYCHDKQLS